MKWQKNGKGRKYTGHYMRDAAGERVIVLIALLANGAVHSVTAESWQMLTKAGWKRA